MLILDYHSLLSVVDVLDEFKGNADSTLWIDTRGNNMSFTIYKVGCCPSKFFANRKDALLHAVKDLQNRKFYELFVECVEISDTEAMVVAHLPESGEFFQLIPEGEQDGPECIEAHIQIAVAACIPEGVSFVVKRRIYDDCKRKAILEAMRKS